MFFKSASRRLGRKPRKNDRFNSESYTTQSRTPKVRNVGYIAPATTSNRLLNKPAPQFRPRHIRRVTFLPKERIVVDVRVDSPPSVTQNVRDDHAAENGDRLHLIDPHGCSLLSLHARGLIPVTAPTLRAPPLQIESRSQQQPGEMPHLCARKRKSASTFWFAHQLRARRDLQWHARNHAPRARHSGAASLDEQGFDFP